MQQNLIVARIPTSTDHLVVDSVDHMDSEFHMHGLLVGISCRDGWCSDLKLLLESQSAPSTAELRRSNLPRSIVGQSGSRCCNRDRLLLLNGTTKYVTQEVNGLLLLLRWLLNRGSWCHGTTEVKQVVN